MVSPGRGIGVDMFKMWIRRILIDLACLIEGDDSMSIRAVSEGKKPIASINIPDLVFETVSLKLREAYFYNKSFYENFGCNLPKEARIDEVLVYKNTPEGFEARETLMKAIYLPSNSLDDMKAKHIAIGKAFGYTNRQIKCFMDDVI